MKTFHGKVAIVTGSSAGIGTAVAIELASLGCSLTLSGRNTGRLTETKNKCLEAGLTEKEVIIVAGDLTDESYLKHLVSETVQHFGHLNILFNNAGIFGLGGIAKVPISEFDKIINTNLRSVILLSQLAIPHLVATKGNIVNVTSSLSTLPSPKSSYYNISKAGIDMFTKCLALELASSQVRVNAVQPGIIETDLLTNIGLNDEQRQKVLDSAKHSHALGRAGKPEEVAKAVAFLASDDASFTTGHLLAVEGGRNVMAPS